MFARFRRTSLAPWLLGLVALGGCSMLRDGDSDVVGAQGNPGMKEEEGVGALLTVTPADSVITSDGKSPSQLDFKVLRSMMSGSVALWAQRSTAILDRPARALSARSWAKIAARLR